MYKFKSGMILGEVIFAFFLCGILLAISIFMFKSNDVSKTPYIYSVLKNLPSVNDVIMQECYDEGSCQSFTELPDTTVEYCERLANNLVTVGNVNCNVGGDSSHAAYTKGQNIRLTNGVAIYGITTKNNWETLNLSSKQVNSYIDVYIDVNGEKNGQNLLGIDIFPVRIFKNGAVVPSFDDKNGFDAREDEEFFAYRVVVNKAADVNNEDARDVEVLDARSSEEIENEIPFKEKVSFKEAICISNPDLFPRYFENENCDGYTLLDACDFEGADASDIANYPHLSDKSAYCSVEPVKPVGSGIFKIFGI